MSSDDTLGVVIDTGSQVTKVGFAAEDAPRSVFPTLVGRFRRAGLTDGIPEVFFGHEAVKNRGISTLTWPVRDGVIKDWDEVEKLWHYTYYKALLVPPEETRVLYAVDPLIAKGDRERISEILFESFAIQALNLVKSPVLVLHASGRTSGLVFESGFSNAYVAPIYEGFPLTEAIMRSSVSGESLTVWLQKLLSDIGYSFTTPLDMDIVERVKAEVCYVAQDFDGEMKKCALSSEHQIRYALPDGQHILLDKERFLCPEAAFQPSVRDPQSKSPTIVDIICSSVGKCDIDQRPLLYGNVVVSGGSSMFPGFVSRLTTDLSLKVKTKYRMKTKIDELPSRNLATWVGGSIIASLDCLKGFWMTKQEYEDIGPDRVNYKFF